MTSGVVTVDTNVLLDLYRYISGPRGELMQALEEMNDRLFVPHQVAVEFWRGREGALNDVAIKDPPVVERLRETGEGAKQSINEWANRVGLEQEAREALHNTIETAVTKATERIKLLASQERDMRASDTSEDVILDKVVALCNGRVGDPPDAALIAERTKEGQRRANEGHPPGYKDKKKEPDRVVGDYLLWCEAMDQACERDLDLVFVTRDTKEDWWTIVAGNPIGPRIELVEEFWHKSSGRRTFFLRPSQFVSLVAEANGWSATDAVAQLESAERVDGGGDWNSASASELLLMLRDSYRPQYEAVKYAAQHAGRVSREVVYEVGGYDPGRTLRGFGRPVNRLARGIYDPYEAMEDFPPVFDSYFNPEVSWVQAAGFYLAEDLAAAVREALATGYFD